MSTYFTVWHYAVVAFVTILFLLLTLLSLREKKASVRNSMIFSSFAVMILVAAFMIMAIDKYTKKAEVYQLKNRRILTTEQIVYSGYVQNVGNYKIGEVKLEIKLVNKGHVTGNVKAGSFYKPSGFLDFFGGGGNDKQKSRPQQVTETFVIARNLRPGKSEQFHVTMPYPPYFKHTADFTRVFAH